MIDYCIEIGNFFGRSVMDIGKYSALLSGVYHVTQDNGTMEGMLLSGIAYVAATGTKELFRDAAAARRGNSTKDKLAG